MYAQISEIENIEQLTASNVNHPCCYNKRKMIIYHNGEGEKRKAANITVSSGIEETLILHTNEEESPPSFPVVSEYDMELRKSSNSNLESKKRSTSAPDSNDQSSESFRKRNSIAISLVVFFDQMVNKRQLAIAIISWMCGMYAVYVALSHNSSVYGYESRHQSAHAMKKVLLIYGLVQLLLSTIFFCIYVTTTKIGEGKWCCQIARFIGCIIYVLVAFSVLFIGLIGLYWVVKLYGHVEYEDRQSADYVDNVLYKSSIFIFSFHICFVLLKCCWWNL